MDKKLIEVVVTAALLLGMGQGALAAECKSIASVIESGSDPGKNTTMGGHVSGHIFGADAPSGWDYHGKTLFTSSEEYIGAWRNYVALERARPLNCSNTVNGENETVSVADVLGKGKSVIGAWSCPAEGEIKVDKGKKSITGCTRAQFDGIAFAFTFSNKKWILVTAFPSNLR